MGVVTLQAIFQAVKQVRMLLTVFLKSKFIFFFELIKFTLFFFTKNNGIIRNDIDLFVCLFDLILYVPSTVFQL